MFENIIKFFKRSNKKETLNPSSKDTAKERLHLVLMQDRANVSADFLDLMRQEIIEVIKKYIDIDESAMDVRLTNQANDDGTQGAPALYANIPILNIKEDSKKAKEEEQKQTETKMVQKEENKAQPNEENKTEPNEAEKDIKQEEKLDKNESNDLEETSKIKSNEEISKKENEVSANINEGS